MTLPPEGRWVPGLDAAHPIECIPLVDEQLLTIVKRLHSAHSIAKSLAEAHCRDMLSTLPRACLELVVECHELAINSKRIAPLPQSLRVQNQTSESVDLDVRAMCARQTELQAAPYDMAQDSLVLQYIIDSRLDLMLSELPIDAMLAQKHAHADARSLERRLFNQTERRLRQYAMLWQLNSVPPLAAATMKNVDSALEIFALDPSGGAHAAHSTVYGRRLPLKQADVAALRFARPLAALVRNERLAKGAVAADEPYTIGMGLGVVKLETLGEWPHAPAMGSALTELGLLESYRLGASGSVALLDGLQRICQEIVRHALGFEASTLVADVALVAGASHANIGGRWDMRALRSEAEVAVVEVRAALLARQPVELEMSVVVPSISAHPVHIRAGTRPHPRRDPPTSAPGLAHRCAARHARAAGAACQAVHRARGQAFRLGLRRRRRAGRSLACRSVRCRI